MEKPTYKVAQLVQINTSRKRPQDAGCIATLYGNADALRQILTSSRLVGQPCGHHGQYTFYKALRLSGPKERIIAIGDFFFVRIWQDSELVSIGELQLLWKDRVSEQTLVSLRLYFLPENTPDGRNQHGEHEVLAINDKVVLKAEDLLSWMCTGETWTWGMRAVWRGACAPPAEEKESAPLHHTKLDFTDVDKEKSTIAIEPEDAGVVVFSYGRYCRYRAVWARLEGLQADWLRDSLVAALGGYAAPTINTRILYCKDTFEYPELEGHEFVCNHLAPKLKGRGRGRRRRQQRSRTQSPESRSSDDEKPTDYTTTTPPSGPRRLSLRNGPEKHADRPVEEVESKYLAEDEREFLRRLKHFYKDRNESLSKALTLKHITLNAVYNIVVSRGGYDAVCRHKLWRVLFSDQPVHTRRHYERYLLAFEHHERRHGMKNGQTQPIDTYTIPHSPLREERDRDRLLALNVDSETGEIKEDPITSKPAAELNQEFLASLPKEEKPKLAVKPTDDLMPRGWTNNDKGPDEKQGDPSLLPLPAPCPTNVNGYAHNGTPLDQKVNRPVGRSSLRAVRVKPARTNTQPATAPNTPPTTYPSLPETARSPPTAPPVTNFGIHHPPPPSNNSDDEIVEVPYKPKTPEIIDLDEYPETESPESSSKKKRLDILKERGLEVTPLPAPWPNPITPVITPNPLLMNPAVQQQIMASQFYGYYTPSVVVAAPYPNGVIPPKVIQATSIFGSTSPEKTVYGNPKDPFMPPPHVLHGVPIKPQRVQVTPMPNNPQDILDLTCKMAKPAVEIVRVPTAPSPSKTQNIPKNYSIIDGKAVVGSNLEITLVNKSQTPPKKDPIKPQKRSSNGKFVAKTPTPPKDKIIPKKPAIVVPSYQIRDDPSPTGSNHSTSSRESQSQKEPQKPTSSFLDPYMALYSLAGQMDPRQLMGGQLDPRQIAAYREAMVNQFRGYSHLLNMGVANPTTKN